MVIGEEWAYVAVTMTESGLQLSRKPGLDDTYTGRYQFLEKTGEVELRVSAHARTTGTSGSDSLDVHVEGIIPGKT